jgi:hypothetical protein
MSPTEQRIAALAGQAVEIARWVGDFDAETLRAWLRLELGSERVLDGWVAHGGIHTRAVPLSPLLHVVSGNSPHAAFQSVLRGLLVGACNRVKLPTAGLPEFERWIGGLAGPLADLIEVRRELPRGWLDSEGAVVFGDGGTIEAFRRLLPGTVVRIEHGPKVSIAVVFGAWDDAVLDRLAADILRFEQMGCLSVQAVLVDGGEERVLAFGDGLAEAMRRHRAEFPRGAASVSASGAVQNARAMARFLCANGEGARIWESSGSTEWTLVHRRDPVLQSGPLHGFVFLHPLPVDLRRETLGPLGQVISTVVLHPFAEHAASRLDGLAPSRICAVGEAQQPTVFWHHDGGSPLSSLVRWRDFG